MTEETTGAATQRAMDEERFHKWMKNIVELHNGRAIINDELYWTPVAKPIQESTVAIVSSIGIHHRSEPAFDILDEEGDISIRFIPRDVDSSQLMATHGHVDTQSANQDINIALPIDRLREFAEQGRIGGVANTHYGIMGWCPPVDRMRDEAAPQIIDRMKNDEVDIALLVPG